MTTPLWIKICGLRDVETAAMVSELGADAIGLNFYDDSPRCVRDVSVAKEIVAALPKTTSAVGLFVNHSAEEIRDICMETGLTTVQLHGDEPDSVIAELSDFHVIRALRTSGRFASEAVVHLENYLNFGVAPEAWLVDARVAGAYGGTGQTIDWTMLAPSERQDNWPRLILAGGLTPENVAEAIWVAQPWGVDVASGVESAPGVKDLRLVERFIAECRR